MSDFNINQISVKVGRMICSFDVVRRYLRYDCQNHDQRGRAQPSRRNAMEGPQILDIGRDAVWVTIVIAAPVLVVGLVVGIMVSLLQTVTQLQEPTLAYVPKILAIFVALIVFLPFMGQHMGSFMERLAAAIIQGN